MQSLQKQLKTILPNKVPGFDSQYFNEAEASTGKLRTKLNDNDISGKIDALTRVLAMSSIGSDVSGILPDVVRQLFTEDSQLKRLAHMCLVLHADSNPELVLLCVNALLKDSSDTCALHRGVAVRTTSLIKTREVSEHAYRAISKASSDSSVYVRKSAALCISLIDTDVLPLLDRLLSDYEPSVVSTATLYLPKGPPVEFLHGHFRRLVHLIPLMDFPGQYATMTVLGQYCMRFFTPDSTSPDYMSFLDTVESLVTFSSNCVIVSLGIDLLSDLGRPVENSDEILARHLYTLPREYFEFVKRKSIVKQIEYFFINLATDSLDIQLAKIRLLRESVTAETAEVLLAEVSEYLKGGAREEIFLEECMQSVKKIAEICPELAPKCVKGLIRVLTKSGTSCDAAVIALRGIMITNESHEGIVFMAEHLERITKPTARVAALWLISRFHDKIPLIVLNALRVAARTISSDSCEVKLQVLVLAEQVRIYHGQAHEEIPSRVAEAIKEPLSELVEYIRQVVRRDKHVGVLANLLTIPSVLNAVIELIRKDDLQKPITANNVGKTVAERPIIDSNDSIREPRIKIQANTESVSSLETAVNRMSSNLVIPGIKPPKPATTLADLDLFFSEEPEVKSDEKIETPIVKTENKKATIDLSNPDWFQ